MRKIGITLIVVLLVVAGAFFGLRQLRETRASAATAPQTMPLRRSSLIATVNAAGNVSARADTVITFRSAGKVAAVKVQAGDQVAAGDDLMQLDTTDFELDVAKARLSLATAEAQLVKAQQGASAADLAAAQASLQSARENLANVQAGPTQDQIASAQATLQSAQERYQQLQAGPSGNEIASAEANLEKARIALQQAQVTYSEDSADPSKAGAAAATYQRAILDYDVALANYNLALEGAKASDVQNALAQVRQAQDTLDKLLASPTESELAAAQSQVAQAESQVDKLTTGPTDEDLAIAEAQVEQAKLSLQQSERRLAEATLTAPFAGTVTAVNFTVGEYATGAQPAVSLADLSAFVIEVPVAEVDVVRVQPGQPVEISVDALRGVALRGEVSEISPVATITQGVVNYTVKILVREPDPSVRAGMTATVRIVVERKDDVLLVPSRIVDSTGPQPTVPVLRGEAVVSVPVTLGASNETMTEIVEGLSEGDLIVLDADTAGQMQGVPRFFGMQGGGPPGAVRPQGGAVSGVGQ